MTSATVKDRLAAAGFAPAEADEKHHLFTAAMGLLHRAAGHAPARAWWIPGRLEVFGKHTDYAGGHSLVSAVPRGFALVARGRADGTVQILDAIRNEAFVLAPSASSSGRPAAEEATRSGWRTYARVVVERLARNFPGAPLGADVALASDLPSASGMSSSSALVSGIAVALSDLAGLRQHPDWQRTIRTPADEAGYYACIENGMAFGPLAGDAGVGTHGGSEDHAAIVCGRPDELTAWRFVPLAEVAGTALPADWTFAIAASGVAARKTGEARDAYNALSARARLLLELWRRHELDRGSAPDPGSSLAGAPCPAPLLAGARCAPPLRGPEAPSLGAALRSSEDAASRLLTLVERHILTASEREPVVRRLRHFIAEDARVLDALEACRAGDRERLGRLSAASQSDAESLLGNQVPETVWLARHARERGAFAASSFGAGFGGSVWALVPAAGAAAFADAWLADYRQRFPERSAATAFTMRPGPGSLEMF